MPVDDLAALMDVIEADGFTVDGVCTRETMQRAMQRLRHASQPSVNPLLLEKIAQIMTKDLKKSLGLKISKPKKGSGRKRS